MGRCSYDKLKSIENALNEIRKLKNIKEPKPGIFYLKNQGFLHFHDKEEKIWADVKDGKSWGESIIIPAKITKKFLSEFAKEVYRRYEITDGQICSK